MVAFLCKGTWVKGPAARPVIRPLVNTQMRILKTKLNITTLGYSWWGNRQKAYAYHNQISGFSNTLNSGPYAFCLHIKHLARQRNGVRCNVFHELLINLGKADILPFKNTRILTLMADFTLTLTNMKWISEEMLMKHFNPRSWKRHPIHFSRSIYSLS